LTSCAERKKISTYTAHFKSFKTSVAFKALCTCKAQALLSKLDEAWRSVWHPMRLRRKGQLPSHIKRISLSRYWKSKGERQLKGLCVRNDGWRMDEKMVSLPKDSKSRQRWTPLDRKARYGQAVAESWQTPCS
jgi:hypothetical protein